MTAIATAAQRKKGPDLVGDLRIAEARESGPPRVPAATIPDARAYLTFVLVDAPNGLLPHLRWLETLYFSRFEAPLGRRLAGQDRYAAPVASPAFVHRNPLPEPQAVALLDRGPDALAEPDVFPDGEAVSLARLLLNPAALWDLADHIGYQLPDAWIPALEASGRELAAELGITFEESWEPEDDQPVSVDENMYEVIPATVIPYELSGQTVVVEFEGPEGAAARRRLAADLFGDPAADFTVRLRVRRGFRIAMEVEPAPWVKPLTLRVKLPSGDVREFVVPAGSAGEAPTSAGRSSPASEPVPPSVFPLALAVFQSRDGFDCVDVRSARG